MSWVILLVFAGAAFAALWRFGKLPRQALELSGAALFLGIAGYAWQGSPGVPGNPIESREKDDKPVDAEIVKMREAMAGRFGESANYFNFSDKLIEWGKTREAVILMRTAIAKQPRDADLWMGLGNALVAQGDGLISPAATFAFERAARLSPNHPGPPFFMGLALVQSGKAEEGAAVWRALLARAPRDAPWKADLEARLGAIGGMPTATGPATP